jgi:hypothetical protein
MDDDLYPIFLVASTWNLNDLDGMEKFRCELNDLRDVMGLESQSALWIRFVNSFSWPITISKPPNFIRSLCKDPQEWLEFVKKYEPTHYVVRTVLWPHLIPIGPKINIDHPIRRTLPFGLYSGNLTLMLSHPLWYPCIGNTLFTKPEEPEKCEALLLMTKLRFVHVLPLDSEKPSLWQQICSMYDSLYKYLSNKLAHPTLSCP